MEIRVEILPGTDFVQAATEAVEKVQFWSVAYVLFKFNGIEVCVNKNSDPKDLYEKYMKALKPESKYKFII
jgi:hypothetical protein